MLPHTNILRCSHILLVAEGCSPQDLVQVLPAGIQVQSACVLLQVIEKCSLHKLEHQIPAAAALPHFEKVHQVVVTQLLDGESGEISVFKFEAGCGYSGVWMKTGKAY